MWRFYPCETEPHLVVCLDVKLRVLTLMLRYVVTQKVLVNFQLDLVEKHWVLELKDDLGRVYECVYVV